MKKYTSIQVVIAATDHTYLRALESVKSTNRFLSIQQIYGNKIDEQFIKDCQYVVSNSSGVAKNRNIGLQYINKDIIVLSDDDVKYLDGFEEKVLEVHNQYCDYDIIVFKIITPENKPFTYYPDKVVPYKIKDIGRVSLIEVTIKSDSIKQLQLKFDEDFGLGAQFASCEETIFLYDCISRGGKVLFYPEYIVEHPAVSSGYIMNDEYSYIRGALLQRLFGNWSYILLVVFAIRKYNFYKKKMHFLKFLEIGYKGIRDYKKKIRG